MDADFSVLYRHVQYSSAEAFMQRLVKRRTWRFNLVVWSHWALADVVVVPRKASCRQPSSPGCCTYLSSSRIDGHVLDKDDDLLPVDSGSVVQLPPRRRGAARGAARRGSMWSRYSWCAAVHCYRSHPDRVDCDWLCCPTCRPTPRGLLACSYSLTYSYITHITHCAPAARGRPTVARKNCIASQTNGCWRLVVVGRL